MRFKRTKQNALKVERTKESWANKHSNNQMKIHNYKLRSMQSLISMENPVADYLQLTESNREEPDDDRMMDDFFKISNAAQDVVWELFFGSNCSMFGGSDKRGTNIQTTQLIKATELLKQLRFDICFIYPNEYNKWIFKVRTQLIRRRLYDFWRFLVKIELGPYWVEDPDITAIIGQTE